jgi:pimeloyl-ACP methyl ester carboxylesterase
MRSNRIARGRATAVAVLGVAALAVPAAGCGPATSQAASADPMSAFYGQRPAWSPCTKDHRLECASIAVPMDYTHPGGKRLTIAISRLRAPDPAKRRGVLVALNGGPGGIGVGGLGREMPARFLTSPVHGSYDIVGFEPRGTGDSTPLYCQVTKPAGAFDSRPPDSAFPAIAADARERDAGCQRTSVGLRPYVNTASTARDLDVIRGVLGQPKISYLGYAYGSDVGAVYGTRFGGHLDRVVLDSAVNAEGDWRKQFMGQAVAAQDDIGRWAEWIGRHDDRFGLGTSRAAVLASVDDLASKLATKPVYGVNRTIFDGAMGPGATYRPLWSDLGDVIGELRKGTSPDRTADAVKATFALAQASMGGLTAPPGAKERPGVLDAVTCESGWPADLGAYYRDMRTYRERYPYAYGVMRAGPWDCTFRSFTPSEKAAPVRRAGYAPGIVVQAEGDTVTNYAGGRAMAQRLGDRLISVSDEGLHELYAARGNRCVDDSVDRYLIDGVLPSGQVTCAGTPRPRIRPGETSAAGGGRLTTAIQRYIQQNHLM